MARVAMCIGLLLGLGACNAEDADEARLRERVAALSADLERARDRVDELERQTLVEHDRSVDLWRGGPTMRGVLLGLPRLGVMRWTCGDGYGFRVVFTPAGASVHVSHHSPLAGAARMLHPGQSMGATIRAGESANWTITHRHPPGFIRAHVNVTAERSKHGNCLLPKVRMEETGRLYD